ncbi:hypothetical protein ES703_83428 [subsurface metagenome]
MPPKLPERHTFVIPSLGIIRYQLQRLLENRERLFMPTLTAYSSAADIEANTLKLFIVKLLGESIGFFISFLSFGEGIGVEGFISIGNEDEDTKSQPFIFR